MMLRRLSLLSVMVLLTASVQAQERVALDPAVLTPNNVEFAAATYRDREAIRVWGSADNQNAYLELPVDDFGDGIITLSLVGDVAPDAIAAARGFVGVAFRTSETGFEAIYLRPKNARESEQLRRNHTVQYISEPEFTWRRLREEFPGRYETYVDMETGAWTDVRIVVEGITARLYVGDAEHPTLIVNDLRRGESEGGIGLWIGPGTVAHFADVVIDRR
jgi:hypothetical protein